MYHPHEYASWIRSDAADAHAADAADAADSADDAGVLLQDFVGSNNIPLLVPSGQFGTRHMHGDDAGALQSERRERREKREN